MIIDFHTHVLPPHVRNQRRRYVESDAAFALIYADEKAVMATADELIENMDRDGVAVSVIANYGWSTPALCIETNDYILESIARYPERLIGFCAVPPELGDAAVAEIERCARGGIRGIGELRPDLQPDVFYHEEFLGPVAAALRRHQLILLTHTSEPVGHVYPGKGSATPEKIYSFIAAFQDTPVVCAHWGGGLPFYALMPEVKEALRNVYFDAAASPFLYSPQVYRQVSQLVGAEKILFGSDYPLMPPRRLLREIDDLELPAAERGMILSGNARRLLGI